MCEPCNQLAAAGVWRPVSRGGTMLQTWGWLGVEVEAEVEGGGGSILHPPHRCLLHWSCTLLPLVTRPVETTHDQTLPGCDLLWPLLYPGQWPLYYAAVMPAITQPLHPVRACCCDLSRCLWHITHHTLPQSSTLWRGRAWSPWWTPAARWWLTGEIVIMMMRMMMIMANRWDKTKVGRSQ